MARTLRFINREEVDTIKKYIIIYTVPDEDFDTTSKGQVFNTLEEAERNAKYLACGTPETGETPVDVYEAELVKTVPVSKDYTL